MVAQNQEHVRKLLRPIPVRSQFIPMWLRKLCVIYRREYVLCGHAPGGYDTFSVMQNVFARILKKSEFNLSWLDHWGSSDSGGY